MALDLAITEVQTQHKKHNYVIHRASGDKQWQAFRWPVDHVRIPPYTESLTKDGKWVGIITPSYAAASQDKQIKLFDTAGEAAKWIEAHDE